MPENPDYCVWTSAEDITITADPNDGMRTQQSVHCHAAIASDCVVKSAKWNSLQGSGLNVYIIKENNKLITATLQEKANWDGHLTRGRVIFKARNADGDDIERTCTVRLVSC